MQLGPRTPLPSDSLREAAEKIRARGPSDELIRKMQASTAPKPIEEPASEVTPKSMREKIVGLAGNLGWNGLWKILVLILLGLIAYQLFTVAQYLEPDPPSRIRRGY